jgi:hypothetical protein
MSIVNENLPSNSNCTLKSFDGMDNRRNQQSPQQHCAANYTAMPACIALLHHRDENRDKKNQPRGHLHNVRIGLPQRRLLLLLGTHAAAESAAGQASRNGGR